MTDVAQKEDVKRTYILERSILSLQINEHENTMRDFNTVFHQNINGRTGPSLID